MLIRSQQKKQMCNLDTAHSLWIHEQGDKFNIMMSFNNDVDYGMGEYSSKAKAIKVLDMIQEEYIKIRVSLDKQGYIEEVSNLPKVFEMPSDEEMEG